MIKNGGITKKWGKSLKNKLTIVILGRSGSGKGMQAKFILARLKKAGVYHMETGRFLRELVKVENPTTAIAKKVMEEGGLVPLWFPAHTWLHELVLKGQAGKHLVFDGSPRHPWEARLLDTVMKDHGRPLPLAVDLQVTEKEAARRLFLRGRYDDMASAIRNRMEFFSKYVIPVILYYGKRGRLIKINGEQSLEKVREDINKALKKRLGNKWPSH